MRRYWWIVLLIGLMAMATPMVVRSWQTDQQVLKVVHAFHGALRTGDSELAVSLLDPELAELALESTNASDAWRPSPGLICRVQRLKVRGDEATADLAMTDGPVRIRPSLKLRRFGGGAWRITRIDGLPKPIADEEELAATTRERDALHERLAIELEQAIRATPGLLVDRPVPDRDRPQ